MSVVNNAQAPTRANNGLPILRLVPWFFLLWWVVLASMIARQTYFLAIAHHQALNTTTLSTEPIIRRGPKILYIVTSMAEFDNGQRNTLQGRDRYQESLVPVVSEAVASMLSFGYEVDLYLITHYEVRSERRELLREKLPTRVGFEVWDDATPLGYKFQPGNNNKKNGQEDGQQELIQPITNALSRQHRLVIKDKLLHYDLFVSFEDDMLINGHHVQHYFAMTEEFASNETCGSSVETHFLRASSDKTTRSILRQPHQNTTGSPASGIYPCGSGGKQKRLPTRATRNSSVRPAKHVKAIDSVYRCKTLLF